jgi:hypothetical protein
MLLVVAGVVTVVLAVYSMWHYISCGGLVCREKGRAAEAKDLKFSARHDTTIA